VEFDSSHSVAAARQLLRERIDERQPVLGTIAERHAVGVVADPDFELTAFGPGSEGAAGPARWRAPSRSRALRGAIRERGDGKAHVVATFGGPPRIRLKRTRRTEAWLLDWLRELLGARA
jgi:hypothetical protein